MFHVRSGSFRWRVFRLQQAAGRVHLRTTRILAFRLVRSQVERISSGKRQTNVCAPLGAIAASCCFLAKNEDKSVAASRRLDG